MLLDLVQPFLRAKMSHEFTEVSITSIHACTIWIFHTSVYDCYLYCTDGWLVFLNSLHLKLHSHMLLDIVLPFLRAEVGLEFSEFSIRQWFLLRYSL